MLTLAIPFFLRLVSLEKLPVLFLPIGACTQDNEACSKFSLLKYFRLQVKQSGHKGHKGHNHSPNYKRCHLWVILMTKTKTNPNTSSDMTFGYLDPSLNHLLI